MMMNKGNRSTLDAYIATETTVDVNNPLIFTRYNLTGSSIEAPNAFGDITLNNSGLYYITFNAYGIGTAATPASATDAITNNALEVQMMQNGNLVPGASGSTTLTAEDYNSISFSKIVSVKPSCPFVNNATTISFINTSTPVTIKRANVVIIKIA